MTIQLGSTLRTNMIDEYETTVGTSPRLMLRSGTQPGACNSADTGSLLASLTLPSDWISTGASGSVTLVGTWSGTGVTAGTAGHYRIKDSAESVTHEQGSVGTGSEDLVLDNAVIAVGQAISITTWTRTMGGA